MKLSIVCWGDLNPLSKKAENSVGQVAPVFRGLVANAYADAKRAFRPVVVDDAEEMIRRQGDLEFAQPFGTTVAAMLAAVSMSKVVGGW